MGRFPLFKKFISPGVRLWASLLMTVSAFSLFAIPASSFGTNTALVDSNLITVAVNNALPVTTDSCPDQQNVAWNFIITQPPTPPPGYITLVWSTPSGPYTEEVNSTKAGKKGSAHYLVVQPQAWLVTSATVSIVSSWQGNFEFSDYSCTDDSPETTTTTAATTTTTAATTTTTAATTTTTAATTTTTAATTTTTAATTTTTETPTTETHRTDTPTTETPTTETHRTDTPTTGVTTQVTEASSSPSTSPSESTPTVSPLVTQASSSSTGSSGQSPTTTGSDGSVAVALASSSSSSTSPSTTAAAGGTSVMVPSTATGEPWSSSKWWLFLAGLSAVGAVLIFPWGKKKFFKSEAN